MTLVGKVLVFLNLILSLVLASAALGVYTQRLDFSTTTATPDRAAGELAKRIERIKQLQASLTTAEKRWRVALADARTPEVQRPVLQAWHAVQLKELIEPSDKQLNELAIKDGQLELDPGVPGQPKMQPAVDGKGQPLRSLDTYQQELKETQGEMERSLGKIKELIEEDTRLTAQLGGPKGLRVQLAREGEKVKQILEEQDYLKPLRINSEVDTELLRKREEQLRARVEELKRLTTASR